MRRLHLRCRLRGSRAYVQYVGQTPMYFGIAAGKRWNQKGFGVPDSAATRVNLRQMHARFYIAGQILDGLSIPSLRTAGLWFCYEFSPESAQLKANPCHGER